MRTQLAFGLAMFMSAACSNNVFSNGDAGDGDDAGSDAPSIHGGDAAGPPGCVKTKLPTDDACVINDAYGIFVSHSLGVVGNDGSREKPLQSLNDAIALAKKDGVRVYACAESYPEAITLLDGVDVFGYFACNTGWVVNTALHAKVQSPTSPAVKASNIASSTHVEALDITAPDFVDQSQSSIALIANSSPGLVIKSSTIHAGTGGKGANGTDAIQLVDSSTKNGANGNAKHGCGGQLCLANLGGAPGTNACTGAAGHSAGSGGSGGSGGEFLGGSPGPGTYVWYTTTTVTSGGLPTVATATTAQGGAVDVAGTTGTGGANGTDGSTGKLFGALSATGYAPSDGVSGGDGQPGQGGGGAGGHGLSYSNDPDLNPSAYFENYGWGESGAGGGAGGCPGLASTSGKGGGASIAIVAIASAFTLDTVVIESSVGGAAGAAGFPSLATYGGSGGIGAKYTKYAGSGGAGGPAGLSGNGGGGPSIGIAYQQGQPIELASKATPGAGGAGIPLRTNGSGATVPASPGGLSAATYAF